MTSGDIWRKIEVVVLVTVVSVLVWLYAEGESLKTETENVRLLFWSANDVEIEPREVPNVAVKVSGPNRSVARFKQLARQPIKIRVEPDPESVVQDIDLRDRLEKDPAIRDLNLQIDETTPSRETVKVERKQEYRVPVTVQSAGYELTPDTEIEPEIVSVQMTPTVRSYLDGELWAYVDLSEVPDLESMKPGQVASRELPVHLPEPIRQASGVSVTPRVARVTFTIRERTSSVVKEAIPIYVRMPVIVSNQYEIVTDNGQRLLAEPVELTGPRAEIEKIEKNERQIYAELQLTTEDLESGVTSKPVHITTPPNVTVKSALPVVKFTIRKRPEAGGT